jgi:uncharacterized protein (TIGR03545 family)
MMFRWTFLVPRLLVVLAFCLWLRFGLDSLLTRSVISSGQMATGARVDLQDLSSSLPHGRLHIRGLAAANPESPLENLFQVDEVSLKIDTRALLDRRWVVDQAAVAGLQFNTDRPTSGALPSRQKDKNQDGKLAGIADQLASGMSRAAEHWLNDLASRMRADVEEEFQSVRLAKELAQRWPEEYRELATRVDDWKARVERIRRLVDGIREEPWEHLADIEPGLRDVEALRTEVGQLRSEMQRMHTQILRDRDAIRTASRHDANVIREKLRIQNLDGDRLSDYLLGPELVARATQLATWIEQGQHAYKLVGERPEINHEHGRGVFIDLAAGPQPPDILFRCLLLSGHTQFDGRNVQFQGRLEGLTHQPQRYGKPVTYRLATRGAVETQIQGTIDYRQAPPRHHLVVSCPAWHQPSHTLGNVEQFAIRSSSGPAQVWLEVNLNGRELSGEVRWRQDEILVDPIVGEYFASERLRRGLAQATRNVDRIHATAELSGTLTAPRCRLRSSLGPQIAEGVNFAVRQELQAIAADLSSMADAAVAAHLEELDKTLQLQYAELLARLQEHEERIEQYKQQLASQFRQPLEKLRQPFSVSAIHKAVAGIREEQESQERLKR